MSLKAFLIGVCLAIVVVMGGVFYSKTSGLLGAHFDEIQRMHVQSVQQFAETAVQGRKYLLSAYRETLDKDNRISKLLLMAQGNAQLTKKVRDELLAIKKRTSCDVVDLVYLNGRNSVVEPELSRDSRITGPVGKERSVIEFRVVRGKLALVSYSPLYLYRDVLAAFVLGYYLNGKIAEDVSRATNTAIEFVPSAYAGPKLTTLLSLGENATDEASVRVAVDTPFLSREKSGIRTAVIWAGCLSLLAVIVLLYLVLDFGFVKAFKSVLAQMDEGAKRLDEGIILDAPPNGSPILEVRRLSGALSKYTSGLRAFETRVKHESRIAAAGKIAGQAAHDIDGPLLALETDLDLEEAEYSESKKRRIQGHIARIREVIGEFTKVSKSTRVSPDFAAKDKAPYAPRESRVLLQMICPLIREVVEEKRSVLAHSKSISLSTEFECDENKVWAQVDQVEFKRTLSNLLDNATEALRDRGAVRVRVAVEGRSIRVEVSDTGKGIPSDVLSKLGSRGVSFGKEDGSGLGLWQAIGAVGSWGGDLAIQSVEGKGTSVTINLSLQSAPGTYVKELAIENGSTVVLLDDEPAVVGAWNKRFQAVGIKLNVVAFQRAEALVIWRRANPEALVSVFLIDFELKGEGWTGLEVIEELGIQSSAVLVTGHAESDSIKTECAKKGIRLLAKRAVRSLPIRVTQGGKHARREA